MPAPTHCNLTSATDDRSAARPSGRTPGIGCGKTSWRSSAWSCVAALSLVAFLAPLLCAHVIGYSYEQQNLALGPVPPNRAHWLGTDPLGRDLLARLLYGGRISLMVGLCATAVSLIIGVIYGAISGFAGGKTGYGA